MSIWVLSYSGRWSVYFWANYEVENKEIDWRSCRKLVSGHGDTQCSLNFHLIVCFCFAAATQCDSLISTACFECPCQWITLGRFSEPSVLRKELKLNGSGWIRWTTTNTTLRLLWLYFFYDNLWLNSWNMINTIWQKNKKRLKYILFSKFRSNGRRQLANHRAHHSKPRRTW